MNRLRQMIKDCPYGNKGCVPGDCVLCSEAPRGIRRECLEIIKQGVATQIFKELEERCPHTPDDAFDWIKRMCPDCFQAIKSKWGIE